MDLKRYYKVVVKIQQCGFSISISFILFHFESTFYWTSFHTLKEFWIRHFMTALLPPPQQVLFPRYPKVKPMRTMSSTRNYEKSQFSLGPVTKYFVTSISLPCNYKMDKKKHTEENVLAWHQQKHNYSTVVMITPDHSPESKLQVFFSK